MDTVQLPLMNLGLGNGLSAITAWWRRSPLVLVEVVDAMGEHHKARLDINKHVFIDALPSEPTQAGVTSVIEEVQRAAGEE